MKVLLLIILSFSAFSQDLYEQMTTPEYLNEDGSTYIPGPGYGNSSTVVRNGTINCDKMDEIRSTLGDLTGEARQAALDELRKYSKQCYINVKKNGDGKLVEMNFENDTKNAINPRTAPEGSTRSFYFQFDGREKQDMNLHITENSGLTGKLSHDLLETKIIFVPRRVVPYMDMNHDQVNCAMKVILPTNEYILFDALTKEIIGGVLEEAPMDMTESRHHREFAGIEYTGNGIMIRADRRAGTPEHTYGVSYNVNEKIKDAVITHKGKECVVNKKLIWENTQDPNATAYFKYATDQDFLDTVINPVCGWNLMMDDII